MTIINNKKYRINEIVEYLFKNGSMRADDFKAKLCNGEASIYNTILRIGIIKEGGIQGPVDLIILTPTGIELYQSNKELSQNKKLADVALNDNRIWQIIVILVTLGALAVAIFQTYLVS